MASEASQQTKTTQQTRRIIFGIIFSVCAVLFYLVKYQGPPFIEQLYRNNHLSFLNAITGSENIEPVEFYVGRANETFLGPLSQLISGLLFAALALLFLQQASLRTFSLAVFVYLVLTKLEVLFFPPYGDAIGGPFAEAIWLAQHNFNYYGLFQEPGYAWGGPKVYMFSIYPTYLALLMKLIPSVKAFLAVNHLIVFGLTAVVVALLREIAGKVCTRQESILMALLLLFLSLFQVQSEAINMEMPCTFFVMLSVYALVRKKFSLAAIFVIASILVKGTGVFAGASLFLVSLFLFFGTEEFRRKKKVLWWGIVAMAVSLLNLLSKYLLNDQHVSVGMVRFAAGWPSLSRAIIFYLYLVCLFAFVGYVITQKKNSAANGPSVFAQWYLQWVMFIYGGMWFALFFNFYTVSPRYRVLVYPFLVFGAFYIFSLFIKSEKIRKGILVGFIILALISTYGLFYGPLLENDHVLLERTLEYRTDLELHRRVVKALEERYSEFKIGAPFIVAQLLAMPELGYVHKKLDVMIYGFNCTYGGIGLFPGIKHLNIRKTIYVGIKVVQLHKDLPYPINPEDKIIEIIRYGNKKAWLFMGGISLESVWRVTSMMKLREVASQKVMQESAAPNDYLKEDIHAK